MLKGAGLDNSRERFLTVGFSILIRLVHIDLYSAYLALCLRCAIGGRPTNLGFPRVRYRMPDCR